MTAASPQDEGKIAEALDQRFERADVVPGVIVRWAIGLGLVSVVSAALAVWLLVFLRHQEEAGDPQRPGLYFSSETRHPEGVRLQSHPFRDLDALRAQEREVLDSYGWVDPAAGVVHIPIETAMQLYAARQAAAASSVPARPAEWVPTDSAPAAPAPASLVTAPVPLSEGTPSPSPSPAPAGGHP